jgi:hypothetical protein
MSEDSRKASFLDLESIFAPIDDAVTRFAERNALRLKKCARGNSGWELIGEHPSGGEFYVLLMYDHTLGLGIGSVWQCPCVEMSRLYSHFRKMNACAIEPVDVLNKLDDELHSIRAVPFGYWTNISPLKSNDD